MRPALTVAFALLSLQTAVADAAQPGERTIRRDGIELRAAVRTAEQTRAFYEARGFPAAALSAISGACFITVGIRNERADTLWLEPARWELVAENAPVRRRTDADWTLLWDQVGLAPGHRATFRWTQLPEQRDLHPGEPVGGNLTLDPAEEPVMIRARFATGRDRAGELSMSIGPFVCGKP